MRQLLLLLIVAASAACKAEPTPRSFYNHRDPAVVELQESEGEIRTRVINFVAAINRGDWRLVQIHLVQPPADSVAADSAATDSTQPSPASDEAPAEDE